VGSVHVAGEDTGKRSGDDRTGNSGLGLGGSWWCGNEVMGDSHLVTSKKVIYQCERGRNLG
jgi:hypothetical protein